MNYYINLQKAIDYIESNLKDGVELMQAAEAAGYSIPHFYRVFGSIIGCSVMGYVRKRRLSNAIFELVTTNHSVTDIAFENGFESHEVFTRTFKVFLNYRPS